MIHRNEQPLGPLADANAPSSHEWKELMASLPGGVIIEEGIEDLRRGVTTVPSLLVQIGAPQLRSLGLPIVSKEQTPEHRLFDLLSQDDPDSAHSRYNALIRLLVSFERAAMCANE